MNKIKTIFSKLKLPHLLLGLLLGLSISAGIILVKAAPAGESWTTLNLGVSDGQILTAAKWNGLVNQVAALVTGGGWPAGNYCIIQDQMPHSGDASVSLGCPTGFVLVNPTQDNFDSARGPIYGGGSSGWDATEIKRADDSDNSYAIRKWAFCCKN